MAERWRYLERNHPSCCTCVNCKGDSLRGKGSQRLSGLGAILESWRSKDFDPHYILGVPSNSSRDLIVEAHRRWVLIYHPDKHQDDPLAIELTKRVNAARDELLGKGRRGSRSRREQQRRQQEAQRRRQEEARRQGAREAERLVRDSARRRKQDEERRKRAREAEQHRRQEEARRQSVREAERLIQDAERRKRSRPSMQRVQHMRKSGSLPWSLLAIALATLIAVHLVLAVQSPDAVDNVMNNWARLFDQALARQ